MLSSAPLRLARPVSSAGFASKAMAGYSYNKKPGPAKRLGLKKSGGQEVRARVILAKQRGFKWRPGVNVYYGKDHTLHAAKEGIVAFSKDPFVTRGKKTTMHVIEQEIPNRSVMPPPPFMYHPELFPELAKLNPDPESVKIPIKKREAKKSTKSKDPAPEVVQNSRGSTLSEANLQGFLIQRGKASEKSVEARFVESMRLVEEDAGRYLKTHDYF